LQFSHKSSLVDIKISHKHIYGFNFEFKEIKSKQKMQNISGNCSPIGFKQVFVVETALLFFASIYGLVLNLVAVSLYFQLDDNFGRFSKRLIVNCGYAHTMRCFYSLIFALYCVSKMVPFTGSSETPYWLCYSKELPLFLSTDGLNVFMLTVICHINITYMQPSFFKYYMQPLLF